MEIGRIKWFNHESGHGFIRSGDGRDVYIHYTSLLGADIQSIQSGTLVSYDLIETEQGPEAFNVEILKDREIEV